MAVTTFGTNDPLAVKLWSKRLSIEVLKESWAAQFMGSTPASLIQIKDETQKSAGDKITYGLRMQMTQDGVQGDETIEGFEEALTTYSDSVIIDQLTGSTRSKGKMTEQRVPFSIRDEGLAGLKDWWIDRLDTSWLNQIAGYVPQTNVKYTGLQAVIAPDADHIIRYGAGATADESITTTATFTLGILDTAVERAKTLTPAIRSLRIAGKPHFAAFLHPYQVTDMRTSTTTGQWLDITKYAYMGEVADNPIFTGSLGVYNGVVLHSDSRVPNGSSAAGTAVAAVRRAVFCGAQSAMIAFGRDNGPEKFTWVEEMFNYKQQLGIAASLIFGLKKTVFNSKDYATIVMATYAAAH